MVAPDALPPSNVGKVGDTFLAADGRFWQKTDATTWTYIDDLTGPPGPGGGINPRGQWSSGVDYAVGDSVFREFSSSVNLRLPGGTFSRTFRSSRSYICKLAHTSRSSNAPSGDGNTYWDAISGDTSLGDDDDEGDPDETTAPQTAYRRSASTPAAPAGTAEAIPALWADSRPSPTATLNVYGSSRTVTSDADTGAFIRATAWGAPVLVARVQLAYRRSDSPVSAAPTGTTHATLAAEGWSLSRLTATPTEGVYRSRRTLTYTDDGTFESATAWSTPIEIESATGPGTTTAPQTAYRRSDSTPAAPAGTAEAIPSPWGESRPPPTAALNVYASSRRVSSHADTGVFISATAWGTVRLVARLEFLFRLDTQTPAAPPGGESTENHHPSGWLTERPTSATPTQGIYQAQRTVTYDAMTGVFESATAWGAIRLVAPRIPTRMEPEKVYRTATSPPERPIGGTTRPDHVPSGWFRVAPPPTATESVYSSTRIVTYHATTDEFLSATAWGAPAFEQGTVAPAVPSGIAIAGSVDIGTKGVTIMVSGSWRAVAGASSYDWELENVTTGGARSGTTTGTSFALSNFGILNGQRIRLRVRSENAAGQESAFSGWVSATVGGTSVTTRPFTGYMQASSTPDTPLSSTENPPSGPSGPSGWLPENPGATITEGVYKLEGIRTYHDLVFASSVWAVTRVRGPIIVTTREFLGYRTASSQPSAPGSSTDTPSGWVAIEPPAHATLNTYKLTGTRTDYDGVFHHSGSWIVSFVRGPRPPLVVVRTETQSVYRLSSCDTGCSWWSGYGGELSSTELVDL